MTIDAFALPELATPLVAPLCILTYVTASGRRCFYATYPGLADDDIPPHIQAQLDAVGATLAWRHVGAPYTHLLAGPASGEVIPVRTVDPSQFARLAFG